MPAERDRNDRDRTDRGRTDRDRNDPEATLGRPWWCVGPPASGKTHHAIARARAVAEDGGRVVWIAPATLRTHLLRRIARHGPLVGLDVATVQQVAYQAMADRRRPLLIGTGRLATVGEALHADRKDPPSPGEARLFAQAVAEAKRHGVPMHRIAGTDPESARLRRIHRAYAHAKGDAWDYDDYLREATQRMAQALPGEAPLPLEADLIVVDGVPELAPAEVRLLRAVARHLPVRIWVERLPPEVEPDRRLPPRDADRTTVHRFPNPVAEARWVLRDVKAELASGRDPLDLALIVPPGRARALVALADEFGLPLMDETPRALADRPEGRRLTDLLELPDAPTPARLLSVPDLQGLGAAALRAGVAGHEAIRRLARERGEADAWRAWLHDATPDGRDADALLAWGERTVDRAFAALPGAHDPAGTASGAAASSSASPRERERFRDEALRRLSEAARVASGPEVRAWWAALLQEPAGFDAPPAGVAVLHPDQATGRRYLRAWLVGAVDGAFAPRDREDYFVPEDRRADPVLAFRHPRLPKRFQGRRPAVLAHLRRRAARGIITVHDADRGGRVAPEPAWAGLPAEPPPERPAGSAWEGRDARPFRPLDGPVDLGPPEIGRLARYARCGFRAWAEPLLGFADDRTAGDQDADDVAASGTLQEAWRPLRRELRTRDGWSQADLSDLAERFPAAADWISTHLGALSDLRYGVRLQGEEDGPNGPYVRLDAAGREGPHARLVRFVAPGAATETADADRILRADGRELWAARTLLRRYRGRIERVTLVVWPIGGEPVPYPERGFARPDASMDRIDREARAVLPAWRAGEVRPAPGFVCRDCPVYDLCREGRR
ncbi:MAG: hypothetical protein WD336_11735 [Trueperaceae bacterium]